MTLSRNTYAGLLGSLEVVDVHAQVILELVNIERAESSSEIPLINSRIIAPMDSNLDKILEEELNEYAMPPSGAPVPTLLSNPAQSVSNVGTVNNPPIAGPDEDLSLASDLSDVLYSAAELAHLRFSKIISVRTPIHNSLPFVSFLEIFDVSWEFLSKCEIKVKRMIVPLRSMMIFQSKTWLSEFHSRETEKMARGVEEEIWVGKDVDEGVQRLVRLLVDCAVRDPEEFLLGARRAGMLEGKKVGGSAPIKDATKQLDIEGKGYFAVAAGLHTLEVLSSYLKIAMNFPLLITETMSRIVEYMKVGCPSSFFSGEADDVIPVIQFKNLSSGARSRSYAICRIEEYNCETSWYVSVRCRDHER
jgi:vacuolar protein sorting-associated protein 54